MSIERPEEWQGILKDLRSDQCNIAVDGIICAESDDRGGSRPFHATATDGQTYWVKQIENQQSHRVPVTEQIIAACGRIIGAPVRKFELIEIPEDLDGEELFNGTVLRKGIAHASLNVEFAHFNKTWGPENRNRDDNRRRHAAYFAFFDWCWGDDRQWIYDTADDMTMYSHDHGHFLPDAPDWTAESLLAHGNTAHSLGTSPDGLDYNELERVAHALDAVTKEQLVSILSAIPVGWPVSDSDLETLGYFLDSRRLSVANRIRKLAAIVAR